MLDIGADYFKEEEREGFVISEMMKRCWAVEMTVLMEIDRICKDYGLTYFAVSGTLLGAIRHMGFIPWDDDIDIAMLRDDFMKFIEISKYELPDSYYVHSYYTTDNHTTSSVGVMNRNDGALNKELTDLFYGFPYIAGVDLFPIDYIPSDPSEVDLFKTIYNLVYDTAYFYDTTEKEELIERLRLIYEVTGADINIDSDDVRKQLWLLSEKVSCMYHEEEAAGVAWIRDFLKKPQNACFAVEAVKKTITVPFEMIEISVPAGYNECLKYTFGDDYMTPRNIPATHGYPFYQKQEEVLRLNRINGLM